MISPFLFQADKVYSKTQSDLALAQREFKRMERDAKNEKTSLENTLSEMKNQLSCRL